MAKQPKEKVSKTPKTTNVQHYSAPSGMSDARGDVYDDVKLDDENDPGAYLGDQYIMLGDAHPEGPWK